jgi:SAM-dependent methyltransferase
LTASRQEELRAEYRRLRPEWRDCLELYRATVGREVKAGARVLDVGCGHAGWLVAELGPASLAAGADPDLEALGRNTSLPCRVAATAERLPFLEGSFDVVVSAWLFEHLERPAAALAEMGRVLRPEGRLVFLTPNGWNYNAWLIRLVPNSLHDRIARRLYGRGERDTYPVRYRLNSPRRVERAMRAAGLRRRTLVLNGDPTYLGLTRPLFALARGLERLLDLGPLRQARVHLVGVYVKEATPKPKEAPALPLREPGLP